MESAMAELLDVLNAFSTPLKMAWATWLAGGLLLVVSYRLARVTPQATAQAPPATVRRPLAPRVAQPSPMAAGQGALVQSPVAPGVAVAGAPAMAMTAELPLSAMAATDDPAKSAGERKPVRKRRRTPAVPAAEAVTAA
jgi:hypothetical protein